MPLGIGIGIWTMAEGSGGPVGYIIVDFSNPANSFYVGAVAAFVG